MFGRERMSMHACLFARVHEYRLRGEMRVFGNCSKR